MNIIKQQYLFDAFTGESFEELKLYVKLGVDFLHYEFLEKVKSFEMFKFLVEQYPTEEDIYNIYHGIQRHTTGEVLLQCIKYLQCHEVTSSGEFYWDLQRLYTYNYTCFQYLIESMNWSQNVWNSLFMDLLLTNKDEKKITWLNFEWSQMVTNFQPICDEDLIRLDRYLTRCDNAWLRTNLYNHPKLTDYPNLLYLVNADRALMFTITHLLHASTGLPKFLLRSYVVPAVL